MSMKLKSATIHRYCCIESDQNFNVEPNTTVLVGMNESGKTSILKALAKSNYFEPNDLDFKYNVTFDYPRGIKKEEVGKGDNPLAITLTYILDEVLKDTIEKAMGVPVLVDEIQVTSYYDNTCNYPNDGSIIDCKSYLKDKLKGTEIIENIGEILLMNSPDEFNKNEKFKNLPAIQELKTTCKEKGCFDNMISSFVYKTYIIPNIPKFMYYDEYYSLPSEAVINNRTITNAEKTIKALFELADIDPNNVNSDEYETMNAELEATQMAITRELIRHWSSNKNLKFVFSLDKKEKREGNVTHIVDHVLKIRVRNDRNGVSLPIGTRSKGFNWFFSFLVWFKKIQADKNKTYILLMDEPGLNLHAKAQNDLLRFIEDELSQNYQVIYTTHSPFMIDTAKLCSVRTVVEKDDGTHISDSIKEHDKDTLFPLQAALGYDIAQNLFISPKNLLVEGVADLVYLEVMSNMLSTEGRTHLDPSITIVPVGGADKVTTFISLLRGNKLDIVCLLDTVSNQSLKNKLKDLKDQSIVTDKRIIFYSDITGSNYSDVEDMFDRNDYLNLYNSAFGKNIKLEDIEGEEAIVKALEKIEGGRFNHYLPANQFAKCASEFKISETTLNRFESLFTKINEMLK